MILRLENKISYGNSMRCLENKISSGNSMRCAWPCSVEWVYNPTHTVMGKPKAIGQ